jgi:hypothetical protein
MMCIFNRRIPITELSTKPKSRAWPQPQEIGKMADMIRSSNFKSSRGPPYPWWGTRRGVNFGVDFRDRQAQFEGSISNLPESLAMRDAGRSRWLKKGALISREG